MLLKRDLLDRSKAITKEILYWLIQPPINSFDDRKQGAIDLSCHEVPCLWFQRIMTKAFLATAFKLISLVLKLSGLISQRGNTCVLLRPQLQSHQVFIHSCLPALLLRLEWQHPFFFPRQGDDVLPHFTRKNTHTHTPHFIHLSFWPTDSAVSQDQTARRREGVVLQHG